MNARQLGDNIIQNFKNRGFMSLNENVSEINNIDSSDFGLAELYSGYLNWFKGNKVIASEMFELARDNLRYKDLKHFEVGVKSYYSKIDSDIKIDLSYVDFVLKEEKNSNTFTAVVSCDQNYFSLFGICFINIFLSHSSSNLHVHIIDPNSETLALLRRRVGGRLSFSSEKTGSGKYPSYCASARFLVAGKLLLKTQKPVLILDIDTVVSKDIDFRINQLLENRDKSVFLSEVFNTWMPWNQYLCGNVLFRCDNHSMYCLEEFIQYYSYCIGQIEDKEESWFIDQNALSYAVDKLGQDKTGDIKQNGLIIHGPNRLGKKKFSELMKVYEESIDFNCSFKKPKKDFLKVMDLCLEHEIISKYLLDSYFKRM